MSAKFTEKDLERAREVVPREFVFLVDEVAQSFADVRAEQMERDALLCIGRCKNKATGAVLAGLIRSGAPITAAEDEP